jgi:mannosyltransferase OCH1-like enzyme
MNTMIPKTIHYCWFNDNPSLPPLAARCVETWKQHLPGWNIVLWNSIPDALPFAQELLAKKRYAFASDYMRFYVILTHGGIYLDADIEVVRPLDPLLNNQQFLGYEEEGRITSGVCGGVAGASFFKACLSAMDNHYRHSKLPLLTPELCTQVAKTGHFPDLTLYPPHTFYPYNPYDKSRPVDQLMYADIKPDTYTIHHWAKSWKYTLPERFGRLINKIRARFAK